MNLFVSLRLLDFGTKCPGGGRGVARPLYNFAAMRESHRQGRIQSQIHRGKPKCKARPPCYSITDMILQLTLRHLRLRLRLQISDFKLEETLIIMQADYLRWYTEECPSYLRVLDRMV